MSAKTAGDGALHCFESGSSGLGLTAAVRAAETVMRGLQITGSIRSSASPCAAIGKPGHGICSIVARH
jgi:hypothetical protein